jgi:serine phosphatase RsbU (regulator of sigma subunit)/anti-sigma regulatory factor (Ser/Thr protein kinase)
VFGAIGITFEDEHAFSDDEVAFLVATTTQCATAFERAIAFEAERAARRGAEAANDRLSYLSEATAVLAQSLDPETTMQRLAELAVPTLGDWCAVHLVEGNFAVAVAMASENPEATAMVRDLSDRHPISLDARAGLGAVIRTGRPVVARRVTIDDVRASTDEGEIVDLLSRLTSIAIVPMIFQGKAIGAVTLSNTTDRILDDAEVQLASELASRAAQAITNARLYQERTAVASTLQASLMPRSPTLIPGVDVATRFVPAQGLDVGGDFYDIFRLGTVDEPAPTWALVIGDVRGKGADAAAITGIARATIRATALDETSPATMLSRLNQVLLAAAQDDRFAAESSEPRFCTACVITVTPSEGGADLVVAVGGHPLPYVLRAGGGVDQVGHYGGLIGVMPSPMLVDVPVHLAPGDALVLYTDGVTERHEGRTFFDEEGLASVLADCAGAGPAEIAESVELRSRGFVDAEPKDDLCIVVARVPEVSRGSLARTTLPSDDSAAALARAFVHDALVAIDAPEVVERAVLLTSELVTNALLHGEPALHVEVLAVPDGVRVAVSDEHPDLPTPRYAEREDEHGRGLRLVEALASKWGVDARSPGKTVWFELDL